MFHRRGAAIAAAVGAVVLFVAGCEDSAAPKGADKPAPASTPTPSASAGPVMPAVVGKKFAEAEALVKQVTPKPIEARSAYNDVTLAADRAQWPVCFQTPAGGSPVDPTAAVELSLVAPGTPCPEQAGATLKPSKAPAPTPTHTPTPAKPKATSSTGGTTSGGTTGGSTTGGSTGGSTSGGGGSVYYKNCTEARAAGAAPIRRGQPGYGKHLDRDGDGIACDK